MSMRTFEEKGKRGGCGRQHAGNEGERKGKVRVGVRYLAEIISNQQKGRKGRRRHRHDLPGATRGEKKKRNQPGLAHEKLVRSKAEKKRKTPLLRGLRAIRKGKKKKGREKSSAAPLLATLNSRDREKRGRGRTHSVF